jgi:hypothetical protein
MFYPLVVDLGAVGDRIFFVSLTGCLLFLTSCVACASNYGRTFMLTVGKM